MSDQGYQEQVPGPLVPGRGVRALRILEARYGELTLITLIDGRTLRAFNSAFGRDFGEEWEHTSLNMSPFIEGEADEFISTSEIERLIDPVSNAVLYQRNDA